MPSGVLYFIATIYYNCRKPDAFDRLNKMYIYLLTLVHFHIYLVKKCGLFSPHCVKGIICKIKCLKMSLMNFHDLAHFLTDISLKLYCNLAHCSYILLNVKFKCEMLCADAKS